MIEINNMKDISKRLRDRSQQMKDKLLYGNMLKILKNLV